MSPYRDQRALRAAIPFAAAALLLAACGGSGATPVPTMTLPEASPPVGSMPAGSGMEVPVGALGHAADAAEADRTIHIKASDDLQFDPASIDVTVGETITFEVENAGGVDHEFVLGSPEYQQAHEAEMESGHMDMGDEPNAMTVAAGSTSTLTWTFTEAGTTRYGCHEPGHYAAGMFGTITVAAG